MGQVEACLGAREGELVALGLECVTGLCEGDAIGEYCNVALSDW